jgi:hypothetical protein
MKRAIFFVAVCFSLGLISCKKQVPQIPSNKVELIDQNKRSLLVINHELAIKEDAKLKEVARNLKNFTKSDIGFWYRINAIKNAEIVKDSTICRYEYILKSLDGKILLTGKNQGVIGKRQLISGLEEGLKLMHKGEQATFIIPWYLGYGMKGYKPYVSGYTSIIYEVWLSE